MKKEVYDELVQAVRTTKIALDRTKVTEDSATMASLQGLIDPLVEKLDEISKPDYLSCDDCRYARDSDDCQELLSHKEFKQLSSGCWRDVSVR